jgi:ferredoxin
MSKRTIISIDHDRCNGCGLCIPNCPEGALQIIDGKARLVSDLFCDGLGACIGHCPEGAIATIEREAEPYDERAVMDGIVGQGENTIRAHLEHLRDHGEETLLAQAVACLSEKGLAMPTGFVDRAPQAHCSVQRAAETRPAVALAEVTAAPLANWPIQLHLLSPMAPVLKGKDVYLAADCTAFAAPADFSACAKTCAVAIACPKLDDGKDVYREKLTALIDHAQIRSLTVTIMEVPCCRGLVALAQDALAHAHRQVPITARIVSIGGAVLAEEKLGG